MRRRLVGGGSSVRTRISVKSGISEGFKGDTLPDVWALEEGEGYGLEAASAGLGGEGDCERTESGEEGGDDGRSSGAAMATVESLA